MKHIFTGKFDIIFSALTFMHIEDKYNLTDKNTNLFTQDSRYNESAGLLKIRMRETEFMFIFAAGKGEV